MVENNSKFVRGKKCAHEDIELVLREYQAVERPDGDYELKIAYQDDADLDKTMYVLLSKMHDAADMRNCYIESNAH